MVVGLPGYIYILFLFNTYLSFPGLYLQTISFFRLLFPAARYFSEAKSIQKENCGVLTSSLGVLTSSLELQWLTKFLLIGMSWMKKNPKAQDAIVGKKGILVLGFPDLTMFASHHPGG